MAFRTSITNEFIAPYHQVIIAVSANSDYETMQEAFDAGVDIFMPKPFNIQAFCEAIEKLFPNRRIRGMNLNK